MNTFLLFVLLLIFIYEFIRWMKYLENQDENQNENMIEKFNNTYTYLPYNFTQEYEKNINIKSIAKDLGIRRNINQVVSSTDEPLDDEFFQPLDLGLFNKVRNRWVNKQRDWQETFTYLDEIVAQKERMKETIKNQ
jgi:hypothetical protein